MKKCLTEKLEEIAQSLKVENIASDKCGVLAGISGIALFQFYYAKFKDSSEYADIGAKNLTTCVEGLGQKFNTMTYCSGIAGLGWVLDHLEEKDFIQINNDEILSDLDHLLYKNMISDIQSDYYDFLHGALGFGVYFFKRYTRTKSMKLKERYRRYLKDLVLILKSKAERDKDGIKWKSITQIGSNEWDYNLSLSHGISSILNFLSRLNRIDEFRAEVCDLLEESTEFIKNLVSIDRTNYALLPAKISKGKHIDMDSRLAWCYGDLGVGLSIWKAGISLDNQNIKEVALEILNHAARMGCLEENIVKDAMLCHGSYGIAQIFSYMYSETGQKNFKNAATFWRTDGLAKATHGDLYGGYKMWTSRHHTNWKHDMTILNGVAGIGLSIIGYLSKDNSWTECMMIA
ncbi:lanthionine synthetase C family protein [Poritiphilus flavus]|uniref:Lanthionine synthetase C-like protein n=1 Tax=Poritiphilus flavus TaxID=2697053 RepID=A0A6L9EEC8_9FLAO|nr:lanthionine synthetase C family protein [Poritiphilus flavus]NAS13001.1 hypothetical protein [Poritiphilus flavus]